MFKNTVDERDKSSSTRETCCPLSVIQIHILMLLFAGGPTGAETIERLCDRVSSATLLEDRRDAVRAIKSLSKKFRLEVGTGAMNVLGGVLQRDR